MSPSKYALQRSPWCRGNSGRPVDDATDRRCTPAPPASGTNAPHIQGFGHGAKRSHTPAPCRARPRGTTQ
jgi:hypothetical protein